MYGKVTDLNYVDIPFQHFLLRLYDFEIMYYNKTTEWLLDCLSTEYIFYRNSKLYEGIKLYYLHTQYIYMFW